MLEDAVLLWRFKRGSIPALEKICSKYNTYLLTVASGLMGDYYEAEDVLQDFFVSFIQSAPKLKIKGSLKSYMAVCVSNAALNRIKRKRLEPATFDTAPHEVMDTKSPDWLTVKTEESLELTRALSRLPFEQRDVLMLHIHGELKFAQISQLRNVSINTVAGRYRYGLEKLRSLLGKEAVNEK